ncbi:MAG: DNA adenine methylase [Bacteroidia bacterium]|nr:DNA adenine methylase [Bacteroidia bacterium]MDW8417416.1 DNA adenine methylase [Bacteroidia bacterium]
MIKYIGSKRALLPWILGVIRQMVASSPDLNEKKRKGGLTILEPFSGSARVGHALKQEGHFVIAGDYLNFAYVLAKALIEADRNAYPPERLSSLLAYLSEVPPEAGWFTEYYAERSRFFQPHNAAKIEAIRKEIDKVSGSDETLHAILLTSLMLAADKVDSTTGLQMAYLKMWAPRSYQPLILQYPPLLPGDGKAILGDALRWAKATEADIAYLDPPYNQHSYAGNYHIWETLVLFDQPSIYGVACKRTDVREKKSPFNSKEKAVQALSQLLRELRATYIVLSFSNEGFFSVEELRSLCEARGPTLVLNHYHKRYIGAQIGIYNPKGEKVGKVSHLQNSEYLFIVCPDRSSWNSLKRALENGPAEKVYIQTELFT